MKLDIDSFNQRHYQFREIKSYREFENFAVSVYINKYGKIPLNLFAEEVTGCEVFCAEMKWEEEVSGLDDHMCLFYMKLLKLLYKALNNFLFPPERPKVKHYMDYLCTLQVIQHILI